MECELCPIFLFTFQAQTVGSGQSINLNNIKSEIKMKTATKSDLYLAQSLKRLATSAGYFFGGTMKARRRTRFANFKTVAELRAALEINSDRAWLDFLNAATDARGFIRNVSQEWTFDKAASSDTMHNSAPRKVEVSVIMNDDKSQSKKEQRQDTQQSDRDNARQMQQKLAEAEQKIKDMAAAAKDHQQKLAEETAKLVQEARESKPLDIVIENRVTETKIEMKSQHKQMPALLVRLNARLNVYLVGPAGSGKTTAAANSAEALGLPFGFMSVGPQTTKTDIMGYQSATGQYVCTEFRRRYEEGGIFLFDEIDAGNGGVLTCINASLAGQVASFPDKMVKRHPDFICVAAGNTYGNGPDRIYVGRQELDGASLDRFSFLDWGYDTALENHIAFAVCPIAAAKWVPYVQAARKAVGQLSLRYVISPRASVNGSKLLRDGVQVEEVRATELWKAMKPDEVKRVTAQMAANGFVAAA